MTEVLWGSRAVCSGERVHVDGRERDVMQDVDAVDLVHFADAMLKVEHGRVVDRHLELGERTQNLHLQRRSHKLFIHTPIEL